MLIFFQENDLFPESDSCPENLAFSGLIAAIESLITQNASLMVISNTAIRAHKDMGRALKRLL